MTFFLLSACHSHNNESNIILHKETNYNVFIFFSRLIKGEIKIKAEEKKKNELRYIRKKNELQNVWFKT